MTRLLELYVETIRTFKESPYEQENSIHKQVMKRINKEKQDTSPQNNRIPLKVK